jgi:hypothetical protein
LETQKPEYGVEVAVAFANDLQGKESIRQLNDTLSRRAVDGEVFLKLVSVAEKPCVKGRKLVCLCEICHDLEGVRDDVFKINIRKFLSAGPESCNTQCIFWSRRDSRTNVANFAADSRVPVEALGNELKQDVIILNQCFVKVGG